MSMDSAQNTGEEHKKQHKEHEHKISTSKGTWTRTKEHKEHKKSTKGR
jgi:hypothetical protein